MALEKRWTLVPPRPLVSNGSVDGGISVATSIGFFVKQLVILSSGTQPAIQFQVKRVVGNVVYVGDPNKDIFQRSDVSAYLVSSAAAISALEQLRATIPPDDATRAVFQEEPVVALRTIQIDSYGVPFGSPENPIAVDLQGGSIELGDVGIKDSDGDELQVNPDGSLNVNVVSGTLSAKVKFAYNEVTSVAMGVPTTIVTYVAAVGKITYLQLLHLAGTNKGTFEVKINGVVVDKSYTYYLTFETSFDFAGSAQGFLLDEGDIVSCVVTHSSLDVADFSGRIQVVEV